MAATMKLALSTAIKTGTLSNEQLDPSEVSFLRLWAEGYADDPVWPEIVAEARALGCWPTKSLYSQLIWYAVDARRVAVSLKAGVDHVLMAEQQEYDRVHSL